MSSEDGVSVVTVSAASNMSTSGDGAMLTAMQDRLHQTRQGKELCQARIKALDEKIRHASTSAPRRPTMTATQIDDEIDNLEYRRTTTTLSLNEEKKVLQDIANLKARKNEIKKFRVTEDAITRLREERAAQIVALNLKEETIREFEKGIRLQRLASRAGVEASAIESFEVAVPSQYFGTLIGKKGANLTKLETEHAVKIDLDDAKETARITGARRGIEAAVTAIQNITLSTEESVGLHPDTIKVILRYRSHIEELSSARLLVNRELGVLRIAGTPEKVAAAKHLIDTYTSAAAKINVEPHLVGIIIGKKGARIKHLEEDTGAVIEIGEKALGEIHIRGPKEAVIKAESILQEIIMENEEHLDEIAVTPSVINYLLEDKGAVMKAIRSQSQNCKIDVHKEGCILQIRGTSAQIAAAKKAISAAIQEVEASSETLKVEKYIISIVIGKNGANIKRIQELSGAKIEIEKEGSTIIIRGSPESVLLAKDKVREIVTANYRAVIKIPHEEIAFVLHANEKAELKKIQQQTGAHLLVLRRELEVIITGAEEPVREAREALREVIDQNCIDQLEVDIEDVQSIIGAGGSVVKKLREDTGANIRVETGSGIIQLRGSVDQIKAAKTAITNLTVGSGNGDIVILTVEPEAIGAIVGKAGAKIKDMQKSFSVSIDIRKSGKSIRIKGEPSRVTECRLALEKIIEESLVSATVDVPEERIGFLKRWKHLIEEAEIEYCIATSMPDSKTIKIRGNASSVGPAKRRITAIVTDWLEEDIFVFRELIAEIPIASIQQIKERHGVSIVLDAEVQNVAIKGNLAPVLRARQEVDQLLRFCFQNQYKEVKVPGRAFVPIMRERKSISKRFDIMVIIDRQQGCVRIFGETEGSLIAGIAEISKLVDQYQRTHVEVKLDSDLIVHIIGKKGRTIGQVTEQSGAKIKIDKDTKILAIDGEEESVAKAKQIVESLIEQYHCENAVIEIEDEHIPLVIGKGGSAIKNLQDLTGCSISVSSQTNMVRLQGSESSILHAKEAIKALIGDVRKATIRSSPQFVRQIIGRGGSTIKDIQEQSGARIDINRENGTIVVRGSESSVLSAQSAIEILLSQPADQTMYKPDKVDDHSSQDLFGPTIPSDSTFEASSLQGRDNLELVTRGVAGSDGGKAKLSKSALKRLRRKEVKTRNDSSDDVIDFLVGASGEAETGFNTSSIMAPASGNQESVASLLIGDLSKLDNQPRSSIENQSKDYYRSTAGYSVRL